MLQFILNFVVAIAILWDAPTTNTDGSPLTNLKGYIVCHSLEREGSPCDTGTRTPVDNQTEYDIINLEPNKYYLTVRAVNTLDKESPDSNQLELDVAQNVIPKKVYIIRPAKIHYMKMEDAMRAECPYSLHIWFNNGETLELCYTSPQSRAATNNSLVAEENLRGFIPVEED